MTDPTSLFREKKKRKRSKGSVEPKATARAIKPISASETKIHPRTLEIERIIARQIKENEIKLDAVNREKTEVMKEIGEITTKTEAIEYVVNKKLSRTKKELASKSKDEILQIAIDHANYLIDSQTKRVKEVKSIQKINFDKRAMLNDLVAFEDKMFEGVYPLPLLKKIENNYDYFKLTKEFAEDWLHKLMPFKNQIVTHFSISQMDGDAQHPRLCFLHDLRISENKDMKDTYFVSAEISFLKNERSLINMFGTVYDREKPRNPLEEVVEVKREWLGLGIQQIGRFGEEIPRDKSKLTQLTEINKEFIEQIYEITDAYSTRPISYHDYHRRTKQNIIGFEKREFIIGKKEVWDWIINDRSLKETDLNEISIDLTEYGKKKRKIPEKIHIGELDFTYENIHDMLSFLSEFEESETTINPLCYQKKDITFFLNPKKTIAILMLPITEKAEE